MRNELVNPITDDEIVECLEIMLAETLERYEEHCGNTRGVILAMLIQRIKDKKI